MNKYYFKILAGRVNKGSYVNELSNNMTRNLVAVIIIGITLCCANSNAIMISVKQKTFRQFSTYQAISDTNNVNSFTLKIFSRIEQLKSIRVKEKQILKITQNKMSLQYRISKNPTIEEPYYWIQVGHTNPYRYEVFFNFYAYPKDSALKYLDVVKDSLYDIKPQDKDIPKLKYK